MSNFYKVISLIAAFALGTLWMAWLDSPINDIPKPIALITGELDVNSKFIVEKFEGVSVSLVTDKLTGCEYVLTAIGGITPRMYSDGIQVCGQSTYPNGLPTDVPVSVE